MTEIFINFGSFEVLVIFSFIFELFSLDTIPLLHSQSLQGGVGSIVAAALQTKGLVDQAKILEDLTTLNELAGLFYFFAIAMAVGSVAVFGNYKQGLYFLIGPALYTFMVTTTTTTNGVKARLGDYEAPNSVGVQTEFLKYIKAIDGDATAKVSLFFATIDSITTEVIQSMVSMIIDTKNKAHLRYVSRERVLTHLLLSVPEGSALAELIEKQHAECSKEMAAFYNAGKDLRPEVIKNYTDASKVQEEKTRAQQTWSTKVIPLNQKDERIKRYVFSMKGTEGFEKVTMQDIREDYMANCADMWSWIAGSLKQIADYRLKPDSMKGSAETDNEDPKSQSFDDAAKFLGASPRNILAANIYKNSLAQTTHGALQSQIFSNTPFNAKEYKATLQDVPGADARGGYFSLKFFATTIPYLQGLLLYLLSIAFPFFAVLLVIPGKAPTFVMWCSLWVWVKSWDLGFAIVHVARELFWHVLKDRVNTFSNVLNWDDPSSVFGLVMNNDPFATQRTYFEIISFMTISVPFLTAHFCLGATNMFEMFRGSIDQTVGRFKTFEINAGKRAILNQAEAARREQSPAVQTGFARQTMRLASADHTPVSLAGGVMEANSRGAQTMIGDPIGFDTFKGAFNFQNMQNMVGVRNSHAMVAYDAAGSLLQLGDVQFFRSLENQVSAITQLETKTNIGLDPTTKKYTVPSVYPGAEGLDSKVPAEVINKALSEEGIERKNLAANREYTWAQFLEADSKDRKERLALGHTMRGLPSMDSYVDRDIYEDMYKRYGSDHPMLKLSRERIEAGGIDKSSSGVTWAEVMIDGKETQRDYFNFIGAASNRRYMPDAQLALGGLDDANQRALNIAELGRTGFTGDPDSSTGRPDFLNLIGAEFLLNKLSGTTESIQKPGIKSTDGSFKDGKLTHETSTK